jgi:hypothetical protein
MSNKIDATSNKGRLKSTKRQLEEIFAPKSSIETYETLLAEDK